MRQLDTQNPDFSETFKALISWEESRSTEVEQSVANIIQSVRQNGDEAVVEYTRRFDGFEPSDFSELTIDLPRLESAFSAQSKPIKDALIAARDRIETFHRYQIQRDWSVPLGNGRYGQRITPMDRAGLYVPGGKAAYPSSILMSAIPAKVAGVGELIMVTPTPQGEVNESVLAAAHVAGVDRVFTIGGAQAVAALAYGTKSVPKVDIITGPGNIWVATAKRQVFGATGIDMIAGPSEVVIVADENANPAWIARDLFAQAEHDEEAQSILISPSKKVIDEVVQAMDALLASMPRKEIISKSLADRGAMIHTRDLTEAVDLVNQIAPEHLQLQVEFADQLLPMVRHAAAIFMGYHSAEVFGDYCAGPSHVLPTSGSARFSSPLGVYDFTKRTSILYIDEKEAQALAPTASVLAELEGLFAHKAAADIRAR